MVSPTTGSSGLCTPSLPLPVPLAMPPPCCCISSWAEVGPVLREAADLPYSRLSSPFQTCQLSPTILVNWALLLPERPLSSPHLTFADPAAGSVCPSVRQFTTSISAALSPSRSYNRWDGRPLRRVTQGMSTEEGLHGTCPLTLGTDPSATFSTPLQNQTKTANRKRSSFKNYSIIIK